MPANVGEMFFTGEIPWHGQGVHLAQPATLEEALKVGGLNWEVEPVSLMTDEDPPSAVEKRKAFVRTDKPLGMPGRVLGVAHNGFVPIQNRDAGQLFDAIFGHGEQVYITGGYLGDGEVVWLMAKIDRPMEVGNGDVIQPYALMANSHDGSMAFNIRLTTVRVVCQNTLSLAMKENIAPAFRRAHQGTFAEHAAAAQDFFQGTLKEFDYVTQRFVRISQVRCSDSQFQELLVSLLPEPKKPRVDKKSGLMKAWERRVEETREARKEITRLRQEGKGMDFDSAKGTFWGALNAVTEYLDHHKEVKGERLAYALLGDGMDLKVRAFSLIAKAAEAV